MNRLHVVLVAFCLVLSSASTFADYSDEYAHECLQLVTNSSGNAITNRCGRAVNYAFCGTDAGTGEVVGVCGRDIGGSLLRPGQVINLTQARHRVYYYYFGCYAPYMTYEVRFTGNGLRGKCYR